MAKDPAFLFYPGDWLGGTMGMTFEQKGAYFELLLFQFNNGKFTEAQAKQVLSICSASVLQVVLQKFSKDGDYYYSKRLNDEIEKRKRFTESRRINAKSKKSITKGSEAYAQHMENENRNRNIDDTRIGGTGGKDREWFVSCIDEMYRETLAMTHKGKNIDQAISESWAYLSAEKNRLDNANPSDVKKLVNTWLGNMKDGQNGKQPRKKAFEL